MCSSSSTHLPSKKIQILDLIKEGKSRKEVSRSNALVHPEPKLSEEFEKNSSGKCLSLRKTPYQIKNVVGEGGDVNLIYVIHSGPHTKIPGPPTVQNNGPPLPQL